MPNLLHRRLIATMFSVLLALPLGAPAALAGTYSPPPICTGHYYYTIPSHSSLHMPFAGAMFKDGPGPLTVTLSVTQSGSIGFTGSVTGGATVSGIVAEVKVEVKASATQTASVTLGHTVQKSVGSGLYLHSHYGSWGDTVTWKYWYLDSLCSSSLISSNTASVPSTEMGWRFYTTTY